jgi:hypothetical protein
MTRWFFPEMYLEVTDEMDYVRVLLIVKGKRVGSTFPFYFDPYEKEIRPTIPEGKFDFEMDPEEEADWPSEVFWEMKEALSDPVQEITKEKFEIEWDQYLADYENYWGQVKRGFPIGSIVHGRLSVFVYVGVFVNIGETVCGIIPRTVYEKERRKTGINWGSGMEIEIEVVGHNSINMWLELKSVGIPTRTAKPFWPPPYLKLD